MSTKTKKQIKKLWTIVLAAACVGLFYMLMGVEAKADMTPVEYAYYNEESKTFESRSCNDYVTVNTSDSLQMTDGKWYVFDGTVEITNRVTVSGSAIIILTNGCEFNAPKGINVASGSALTIYGQTINGATAKPGKLITKGEDYQAGIGGGKDEAAGYITINGGEVNVTGGVSGAGIGGGFHGTGGIITINGGEVTATGGEHGAGIGGGNYKDGGNITISGGKVTAIGEGNGAGIGGGSDGSGGIITINGGEVTATGSGSGAGIGGGDGSSGRGKGAGGTITINGGRVKATAGSLAAGIGGGYCGAGGTIKINGGMIEAVGGEYDICIGAGIGDGADVYHDHGTYTLGTGMKWFSSADETTGYVEIASGSSLRYSLVYKENSAYMIASGSAITAKYIDGSGNKQSINLEIKAPSEILFGDDATAKASLEGLADLNSKLGNPENEQVSVSQIQYYDINGQLLSGAPTAKGNYTAKITVDGVTAAVDYAITKDDPVITAPVARSLTYTGSDQSLVTGGSTTGGTLMYSLSESGPFSSEIPTGKDAKTYTVYYMVEGDSSYKSSKVYSVSVEIRSASPISSPDTSEETAGTSGKTEKSEKTEVPKPSIFTRKNKDGSETTITIIWNEDGTTTVINENKQADGSVEKKEETRDSKGNGTLKIEKKDADGKLLSSTEGTIKVNKKGTETIKSVTENADGSKEEKTQKTYKRDPEADNIKKVTISEKKTDAAGNTETIKTTAFVGVLGDATVTEKSEFTFVAAGDETEENGADEKDKSGTGKDGNKNTKIVVKEERHYDVSVNGRVKLLSLTTDGENVTIPESIELDGMKRVVKSIGRHALKGNKTVKEVALGKNITTICAGAFKNCKNLELIELTGSVKTINKNAFKGIAENAKFVIEASEEDFERIVELLKKSGVSETVTFERV